MHDMDDIAREFVIETSENLNQADTDMVALESNPGDRELLSRVFRTIHTIKGACGFLGYLDLGSLTHNAENLLGLLRDGEISLSEEMVTAILETLDSVRRYIADIEDQCESAFEIDQGLIDRLAALSVVGQDRPQEFPPGDVDPVAAPALMPRSSPTKVLRVRVELIDQLMNLVGELVLARNQLTRFIAKSDDAEFNNSIQCLTHVTDALQESIMKTRMQPIDVAWRGIPRLVRDLAKGGGKTVAVHLEGSDTELDKSVIEAIKDPLVHLVRNVVDHGIERPDERVAKGKPRVGCVRLRAYHQGGEVNIQIEDDGRGFDIDRLRDRAIALGAIDADQASRMTVDEITNLAFLPGLSTAAEVSSVSGRGVGMDVVKTNVEALGGIVDLHTEPGRGSRTQIKIPLTLAIVPAITVTCGSEQFAIPQIYLQEFARLDGAEGSARIEYVQDAPVCRLRDHLFPLMFLDERLGLRDESLRGTRRGAQKQLVVLNAGGSWFGLVVDDIGNPEEIVVKPLPMMLRGIPVLSGAAVIGDGNVALILDVLGLAQQCRIVSEAPGRGLGNNDEHVASTGPADSHVFVEIVDRYRAAIPISAVERLETIALASVQDSLDGPVFHRGTEVVPIHDLGELLGLGCSHEDVTGSIRLIVCRYQGRPIALRVARILDVITNLRITPPDQVAGRTRGTAVIDGQVLDVIDPLELLNSLIPTVEAN